MAEVDVQTQRLAANTLHRTPLVQRRAELQRAGLVRDTNSDDVWAEPDDELEASKVRARAWPWRLVFQCI